MPPTRYLAALCGLLLSAASAAAQGPAPTIDQLPESQRLSARVAIATIRATGAIRYFHPTDSVLTADWDAFTVDALRRSLTVTSPGGLSDTLATIFARVAPTVRFGQLSQAGNATRPLTSPFVAFWEHVGFRPARTRFASRLFSSTRRIVPVDSLAAYPSLGDPSRPAIVDLGLGLRAEVPVAVPVQAAPDSAGRARSYSPRELMDRHSARDLAVRLASIADVWNAFEHFYPYRDTPGIDWNAALERAVTAAILDSAGTSQAITLKRLVAEARDGHGSLETAAEAALRPTGITLGWIENRVVVTAVAPGVSGILPGDVVTTYRGNPVGQALQRIESMTSGATDRLVRYRALDRLARSVDTLALGIDRNGTALTVKLAPPSGPVTAERKESVRVLEGGIHYIEPSQLPIDSVPALVASLRDARGIVIDLRWPQMTNAALALLGHFVADTARGHLVSAPVTSRPSRDSEFARPAPWPVRPRQPRLTTNVAFITHGSAMSYLESLIGAVEHNKIGEIVGEATGGTNGELIQFISTGNYAVSMTLQRVTRPDGSRLHGIGIAPTVPVTRTIAGVAAGRDELLEKAVDAVRRRAATRR